MPAPRSHRRARLSALVSVALAFTGLQLFAAAPAANAVGSTGLVISEIYVNGGSAGASYKDKFVELYNPTASGITFTGSVQYRPATNTGVASGVAVLTSVTIPSHDFYLIKGGSNGANGANLPTPDATQATLNGAAGGGTFFISTSTVAVSATDASVVDKIGYGSSNSPEGTAPTGNSVILSYNRNAAGADTDVNSADFTTATPTPTASAPGPLAATNPGNKNGVVGTPISGFTMAATGGTPPYTWSDPTNSLPPGISVSAGGAVSGTPTTANTYNVSLTVTDSAGSPATATTAFTFNITNTVVITAIKDIQGTTATSPVVGQTVTTEGKVTASYPTNGLNGFYIQSTTADAPNASDALFVFKGAGFTAFPAIGDSVRVTGVISEFSGLTEMTIANNGDLTSIADLGTVPVKTQVPDTNCAVGSCPADAAALNSDREASEGELFQPTAPWSATDVYDGAPLYNDGTNGTSNFGEIGLAEQRPSDHPGRRLQPELHLDQQARPCAVADAQLRASRRLGRHLPVPGRVHVGLQPVADRADDGGQRGAVRHPAAVLGHPHAQRRPAERGR
jgi:5'-nucleotidase